MAYTGNQPSVTSFPYQYLTGDGTTINFSINYPVSTSSSILVSINGLHVALSDYVAAGTTLRFNTAPALGAQIEVVWLGVPTVTQGSGFYSSIMLTTTLAGITITSNTLPPSASFQIGGILGVASGGTGITTAMQNQLLTSPQSAGAGFGTIPYGSANQVLTSAGTNSLPIWANAVNSLAIDSGVGLTLTPASGTGSVRINGGALNTAFGGTGTIGLPNAGVVLGGGTAPMRVVTGSGAAGQVLTSNGTNNDPSWQTSVTASWTDPTAIPIGGLIAAQLYGSTGVPDTFVPPLGSTETMDAATFTLRAGSPPITIAYGTWRYIGGPVTNPTDIPAVSLWVRTA